MPPKKYREFRGVYLLIIINFVVFFIFNIMNEARFDYIVNYLGMVPELFLKKGYLWQPFTYFFIHGNFSHIFWNMFALFMFGIPLETLWGKKKFLSFYFLSGIISGAVAGIIYFFIESPYIPIVGASGSIYALLIGFALSFPDELILLFFIIPVKAKYTPFLFAIIDLFLGVKATTNIAHFAHLTGLVVGFLIYIILFKKRVRLDIGFDYVKNLTKNVKGNIVNFNEENRFFLEKCLYKLEKNIYFSDFEIRKLQKLVIKQGDTIVACNHEEFDLKSAKCLKCRYLPYCILREIKKKNIF